jgi:hypothetical protein
LRDHVARAANLESAAWLEAFAFQRQADLLLPLLRPGRIRLYVQERCPSNDRADSARRQSNVIERHEGSRVANTTFMHEASIVRRILSELGVER